LIKNFISPDDPQYLGAAIAHCGRQAFISPCVPGTRYSVAMPHHIPTLYLDASVIGGYFDEEWQCAPTRKLWRLMEAGHYRFVTSLVTVEELAAAPEPVRGLLESTFAAEAILPLEHEAEELAAAYMQQGILPPRYTDDARHVTACVLARVDFLVSWNFKHLVNVRRCDAFNGVNLLQGYPPVRIVTPRELLYDDAADFEKL
jgi:hypothetical protein